MMAFAPALAGLHHALGVVGQRAHDVDGDETVRPGDVPGRAHLAVECLDIGRPVHDGIVALAQPFHQVGMQAAQIDAGDGAHGTRRATAPANRCAEMPTPMPP